MKKLLTVIFCAALLWNIFADERQIPNWVDMGFTTKENEGKYYWNGDIEEEGIFFSGRGVHLLVSLHELRRSQDRRSFLPVRPPCNAQKAYFHMRTKYLQ